MSEIWPSVVRITAGAYWVYFASQKWQGIGWMHGVMQAAAQANPIPGLHEFLTGVVVPNWVVFALAQTACEHIAAILLILGLATRWAGILGLLLAVNLALTVGFAVNDDGFRWLYYLAVVVNAQVIAGGAGSIALSRFKWVPALLR
jgi:uncharacterized membrane protein YphA (DoxX/SURF4 family)